MLKLTKVNAALDAANFRLIPRTVAVATTLVAIRSNFHLNYD